MWWMPILAAMGINAGKNILTGQNPLKGTLESGAIAGATGGLLGNTIPVAEVSTPAASSIAADTTMKQIGDTFYNPEYFAGTSFGTPIYTGGEGLLSNIGSNISDTIGDITPQNLAGVASLLSQEQQPTQYQQSAGVGGVSKGNTGGLSVQFPQAKVFKKRGA